MQIKTKEPGSEIIYESNKSTVKDTVQEAIDKGIDLSNAFLYKADLSHICFKKANLSNADFRGTDLFGAKFHEANLQKTDFRGASFLNVDFGESDLNETYLLKSCLSGSNIKDIKNYFRSTEILKEICKREYKKFSLEEKAILFELEADEYCSWADKDKTDRKTLLSIFKKIKEFGWSEYYDNYVKWINTCPDMIDICYMYGNVVGV